MMGSTLKGYIQGVAHFLIVFLCHRLGLRHSSRDPFIDLSINGMLGIQCQSERVGTSARGGILPRFRFFL